MPIALTCDCGARFDLDDTLVGQQVPCPECLQPLEVPASAALTRAARTSLLALVSLVLAMVGALTAVGTVTAVPLGCAALIRIRLSRGKLVGTGFALAGVLLGLGFTTLTLALLWRWPRLVPIDGWMRHLTMAAEVSTEGALQVLSRDGNVIVTRPSRAWGYVRGERSDDSFAGEIQEKRELLLVNLKLNAFLDVKALQKDIPTSDFQNEVEKDLESPRPLSMFDDDDDEHAPSASLFSVERPRDREPVGSWKVREFSYDKVRGGLTWRFLIRVYRKRSANGQPGADPIYLVRGYAPKARFAEVKDELIAAMDRIDLPK